MKKSKLVGGSIQAGSLCYATLRRRIVYDRMRIGPHELSPFQGETLSLDAPQVETRAMTRATPFPTADFSTCRSKRSSKVRCQSWSNSEFRPSELGE